MRKSLSILVLTAIALPCLAQDTLRMTLDSCLRYASIHNLDVIGGRLSIESANATLSGAKMNFLPSINATASQGLAWSDNTTRSGNYGVNGNLTLFNGLSNVSGYRQAKLSAQQSSLAAQKIENDTYIQIVSAYLTILMNEEKLQFQQEVLETTRQQQLEGELKYQVGKILESDYLLLNANYISAQAEIENTRLTIDDNRQVLKSILEINDPVVIEVVPSADTGGADGRQVPCFDTIMARARQALPDWQISQLNVDIARLNVNIARSALLPSLDLNAGVSYNEGSIISDNPATNINGGLNTAVTLGLNIPIFNRGASLSQLKKSKISLQQAQLDDINVQGDLEDAIFQLHTSAAQALNRYRANESLEQAYKASYDVYVLKHAEGAVTTVEMLQQQDKYLSALNDYLQAKYSYLLADKQLAIYTGREVKL